MTVYSFVDKYGMLRMSLHKVRLLRDGAPGRPGRCGHRVAALLPSFGWTSSVIGIDTGLVNASEAEAIQWLIEVEK